MKKALSLFLTAALLGTLCLPAAAAEAADARLTAVTQTVKTTLGIDTGRYTDFYGDLSENELAPTWDLTWSGEDGSLNVTAGENGKVLRYYRSDYGTESPDGAFGPTLPKLTREEAQKTAQAFLDRVLEKGTETAVFDPWTGTQSLSSTRYYFSGTIYLQGLPSPLTFGLSVELSSGGVVNFYRDDLAGSYLGGIPQAQPRTGTDAAAEALKGTLSLRLEYVLDGEGGTAVLRYLPNSTHEFYVDAQSGALVDLTALYEKLRDGGAGGNSAAPAETAAAESKSLTRAEQEGIEKLEGVLDKAALDEKLQAVAELGLAKYTLASATYTNSGKGEDAKVTARLAYARQDGEGIRRRTVTVDAKTGALLSVYSSMPWSEGYQAAVGEDAGRKSAEAFLTKYYGAEFAETAPYETPETALWRSSRTGSGAQEWSFRYVRQENGYFYADNYLSVSIDSSDGTVSSFRRAFDPELVFDSPEGIISGEKALDAYFDSFTTTLGYQAVPEKLDLSSPEYRPLAEMGISYLYALKLGYALETEQGRYVEGVDAKSGELVSWSTRDEGGIAYSDLDGHWVKSDADALAQYGVGWAVEAMEPSKPLTQVDLVALLLSTRSGGMDPAALSGEEIDGLYSRAYSYGLLKREDRDEAGVMTRGGLIKMLLDSGGYGDVAQLQGIFRCSFTDEGGIPAELYGYAALAQGLGIVSGDGAGSFAAGREATRAEAVSMLYRFMTR